MMISLLGLGDSWCISHSHLLLQRHSVLESLVCTQCAQCVTSHKVYNFTHSDTSCNFTHNVQIYTEGVVLHILCNFTILCKFTQNFNINVNFILQY